MAEAVPQKLYVKVGDHVIQEDLSPDKYAEVSGGTTVYVRKAFADKVNYVTPAGEQGFAYVKPTSPGQVLGYQYNVALYTRFIGTSGYMTGGTYYKGQKLIVKYQYVRPLTEHAQALLSVVGLARALNSSGLPWSAIVVAYVDNRPRVLYVKSIYAWYQRYHTRAGVKAYPEVRFIFTRHLIGGLRKKEQYYFDLIMFYKVPTTRATAARTSQYVRAVKAQPPAPQPPAQAQVELPARRGNYVQAVADQYVQQADQEQTIAELEAKEKELLGSAFKVKDQDLLSAINMIRQTIKLREKIREARRRSTA